eukprot:gnl/TRDRNA2_/TRDRNA2_142752_c1_seq1.p1 gnl/TRDRNA2_/TRDRNA2_142752_c1~~gnl/TRDRNA2_/TRDRNA2_142752_c1_seq1.p1  ORF type:complete len:334 (+),score=22.70 gnl/TRDRNA2_/TRDRNA2_142752_c1_seq1:107-1003(+)
MGYIGEDSNVLHESTPYAMMHAHPGFSWCVSNCFRSQMLWNLLLISNASDRPALKALREATWELAEEAGFTRKDHDAQERCADFLANRKVNMMPANLVVAVISGSNGGSIRKAQDSWASNATIMPSTRLFYVADTNDLTLPVLSGNQLDYTTRFLDFVYLMAICPPMKFEWLLIVDDNAQIYSPSIARLRSSLRSSQAPIIANSHGCCAMFNDVAMHKLYKTLQGDGGASFRSTVSGITSGDYPTAAAGLLRFLVNEVKLEIDTDLSAELLHMTRHPLEEQPRQAEKYGEGTGQRILH